MASLGPLVVIIGETGSGKSDLAMDLAEKFNGEIICADSRTVYRGMDIGTAKPSQADQQRVRHHLLDVVNPDEKFNVAQFKQAALEAIEDISSRGKLPILVGGSGLYVDSVIFDYQFALESERDMQNPRHQKSGKGSVNKELRPSTLVIGVQRDRADLENRLKKRVETMVEQGLIEEVEQLLKKYPSDLEVFNSPAYESFIRYLNDGLNLNEAKALFVRRDLQLAKKQRTWFKRNKSIQWLSDPSKSVDIVTTFLSKFE